VLVILGINLRGDCDPIRVRFIFLRDIGLEDASQFNLGVNGAVLVKMVIPDIFCGGLHLVTTKDRRTGKLP